LQTRLEHASEVAWLDLLMRQFFSQTCSVANISDAGSSWDGCVTVRGNTGWPSIFAPRHAVSVGRQGEHQTVIYFNGEAGILGDRLNRSI